MTAGVYVLIRFNYLFVLLDVSIFRILSVFTMVLAGYVAWVEVDFKKVVAMSTLSQLGFILYVLRIGVWFFSFIHLIIHAFFKSMLFLRTGSLMGQFAGKQDIRFYGGDVFSYGSFLYFVVSCFCLSGFPFLVGFYSKDAIIVSRSFYGGEFFYFVFLVGCLFTVGYRFRLVKEGFVGFYKSFSYLTKGESLIFFFFVCLLFFVGWLTGGVFYWLFVVESVGFFIFFDLMVGVFIIFLGGLTFYVLGRIYVLFVFFVNISFMRWVGSRGTSFFFGKNSWFLGEGRWLELGGGQGFWGLLNFFSLERLFVRRVSFGIVVFWGLFRIAVFFCFLGLNKHWL